MSLRDAAVELLDHGVIGDGFEDLGVLELEPAIATITAVTAFATVTATTTLGGDAVGVRQKRHFTSIFDGSCDFLLLL